jgi:putative membrane protein
MIKKVLLLFFVFSFLGTNIISAMEMKPKSIDAVMNEIRQEQGLKKGESVKVEKVSPMKLEELGDSVMEVMIGNPEQHEQMDKMMGGEGSASLADMHRRIGYNYLAGYPYGMMRLMSGGMMGFGGNFFKGGHMMGGIGYGPGMMGFGWGGMLMGFVILLILVFVIILIVRAIGGGLAGAQGNETALDILKKRYAKGEISKDEFNRVKKDLEG